MSSKDSCDNVVKLSEALGNPLELRPRLHDPKTPPDCPNMNSSPNETDSKEYNDSGTQHNPPELTSTAYCVQRTINPKARCVDYYSLNHGFTFRVKLENLSPAFDHPLRHQPYNTIPNCPMTRATPFIPNSTQQWIPMGHSMLEIRKGIEQHFIRNMDLPLTASEQFFLDKYFLKPFPSLPLLLATHPTDWQKFNVDEQRLQEVFSALHELLFPGMFRQGTCELELFRAEGEITLEELLSRYSMGATMSGFGKLDNGRVVVVWQQTKLLEIPVPPSIRNLDVKYPIPSANVLGKYSALQNIQEELRFKTRWQDYHLNIAAVEGWRQWAWLELMGTMCHELLHAAFKQNTCMCTAGAGHDQDHSGHGLQWYEAGLLCQKYLRSRFAVDLKLNLWSIVEEVVAREEFPKWVSERLADFSLTKADVLHHNKLVAERLAERLGIGK